MNSLSSWNLSVLAVLFISAVIGCSVTQGNNTSNTSRFPRMMEQAKKDNRYLIMHSGMDSFAITSLLVEKGKKEFTFHLNKIDSMHRIMLNNTKLSKEKYMHIFMRDSSGYTLDEPHTIPIKNVLRIELVN